MWKEIWLTLQAIFAVTLALAYIAYAVLVFHVLLPVEIVMKLCFILAGKYEPEWLHKIKSCIYGPFYDIYLRRL